MKREGNRENKSVKRDRHYALWASNGYGYAIPGLVGIGVIVVARLLGVLQPLEWAALDAGLRWRLPEPMDERIVIVGINEEDIQEVGAYPIPDQVLADLLWQLQSYNPRVIGLDIVRDLPVEPGHGALVEAFRSMENVIGAESVAPDTFGATIEPPPTLPPEQVGLIDNVLDADGRLRRSLLWSSTDEGDHQFSMAVRLAMAYLQYDGIELDNGIRDPDAMRFGTVELPRFHPNSGGYVRADAGGVQTLFNVRSGPEPFREVSLTEVLDGSVDPGWFRDRVVLIGITASSIKDFFQTSAVTSATGGLVFGVEMHAHATSQILSAVLDGRSLLRVWVDGWEYGWIILWGVLGIGMGRLIREPTRYFLSVVALSLGLLGIGYLSLLGGWWLPVVPALIVFLINGVIFHAFYLYYQALQSRIRDRQLVIEQTFTAIHNGPLQTLAGLIRDTNSPEMTVHQLHQGLQHLNRELRSVYDAVQKEAVQDDQFYLPGRPSLDLEMPLHELLYEVYADTLQRNFPHFSSLKAKIVKFEPFDERYLSPVQKRSLCRFLEEALCNVGKHATGATRLMIECRHDGASNIIRVIDNGCAEGQPKNWAIAPANSPSTSNGMMGRGTQQAKDLAKQLDGTFERSPYAPKGTRCELTWQPSQPLLDHLSAQIKDKFIAVFGKLKF